MIAYRPSPVLILGVLLGLSVTINLWQAKTKWVADAVAPLKAELDTANATAAVEDKVGKLRVQHELELAEARSNVMVKAGKREVIYRDRIGRVAAPNCPPGADRVDAWNAIGQGAVK